MKVCVQNGKLKGNISVPGSKSLTIRALILAAMSYGITEISNPLESQDCLSTLNAITKIGAKLISKEKGKWIIQGAADNLHLPDGNIDVGNSGSLLYFLTPVLSTLKGECIFTGDESICKRPVSHLIDALQQMGAQAKCLKNKDCPPFSFCGPITSKKILNTEGKLSQYISGFMMASSKMDGELQINLSNPQETPYLTMTQTVLKEVGIESTISTDYKKINVKCGKKIEGFKTTIASDWEGVAFPLVAALVSGSSIKIENIDFEMYELQAAEQSAALENQLKAAIEYAEEKKNIAFPEDMNEALFLSKDVARILLADVYMYQGKYSDAEPLLQKVFDNGFYAIDSSFEHNPKSQDVILTVWSYPSTKAAFENNDTTPIFTYTDVLTAGGRSVKDVFEIL